MKPGYKTTEFWLTAAVVGCAFAYVGFHPANAGSVWSDVSAIVLACLAAIGYTSGRQKAKSFALMEETTYTVTNPPPQRTVGQALRAFRPDGE